MARKKTADTDTGSPAEAEPKVNKTEAVKAALAEGVGKPQAGAEFIKTRFGLDVTPQMFSQTKSLLKKKGRDVNGTASHVPAHIAPASSNGHHAPVGVGVAESVEAIKLLVNRMGAEEVIKIAGLFKK